MSVDTGLILRAAGMTPERLRELEAAETELRDARTRIEQLERLVCSDFQVCECERVPYGESYWSIYDSAEGVDLPGKYDTKQAAIDAAIKHLEAT